MANTVHGVPCAIPNAMQDPESRQCRGTTTTGQSIFAEGLTLGKEQPSAKTLCQGPDPRQIQAHGNNNYLPRAKPSAKGRPSATPPDTMSIPYRQSLPRASPLGPRQRLFNRFWKFSFKIFLPSAHGPALGKDSLCRVPSWHSANFHFFLFFWPQIFCWVRLHCLQLHVQI